MDYSFPHALNKRTTLLFDVRAVRGAMAKGTSSARTLHITVRRIAAQALAGGLTFKLVYVPSQLDLADAPSRGARTVRRNLRTPVPSAAAAQSRLSSQASLQGRARALRIADISSRSWRLTHLGSVCAHNEFQHCSCEYEWSDEAFQLVSSLRVLMWYCASVLPLLN